MIFFFFHYQTWGSIRLISNRLKYLDILFSHSLSLFSSEYFDIFFFFGGFGSVKLFVDLSELSMGFVNFVRLLICLILIWSFFCCWIFSMNRLVFATHLICRVDLTFESVWSVCILVFCLCLYVYIVCLYLSFAEINAMCFILFSRLCILWLGFCVCVVGFDVLFNEMIWDMRWSKEWVFSVLVSFELYLPVEISDTVGLDRLVVD